MPEYQEKPYNKLLQDLIYFYIYKELVKSKKLKKYKKIAFRKSPTKIAFFRIKLVLILLIYEQNSIKIMGLAPFYF